EETGKAKSSRRAQRRPSDGINQEEMEKRYRRGDRSQRRKGSNVANTCNEHSAAQRPGNDTGPKTCAHDADLSWRKPFNISTDAQQSSLQRVSHLHKPEAKEQGKQLWQDRAQRRCHLFLLGRELVGGSATKMIRMSSPG